MIIKAIQLALQNFDDKWYPSNTITTEQYRTYSLLKAEMEILLSYLIDQQGKDQDLAFTYTSKLLEISVAQQIEYLQSLETIKKEALALRLFFAFLLYAYHLDPTQFTLIAASILNKDLSSNQDAAPKQLAIALIAQEQQTLGNGSPTFTEQDFNQLPSEYPALDQLSSEYPAFALWYQEQCQKWKDLSYIWYQAQCQKWKDLSYMQIFIGLLTIAFMIICGMTTGGFILEQIAGDDALNAWQKAIGIIGAIISGNAQKSIFFEPLQDLVTMCTTWLQGAKTYERVVLVSFTCLSAACTFMINYGLSSFGAKLFMTAILGITGLPGWVALIFALFFALMNALLVLSGTLNSIADLEKNESVLKIMGKQFAKNLVLSLCVTLVAAWGLIMTFYPGADEVATQFGGIIIASFLLLGAMWSEGYYAYKKLIDTWRAKHIPKFEFWACWDKLCAVLNAITVVFMGIEGGKRAANTFDVSNSIAIGAQAIGGATSGLISYAYTVENTKPAAEQEEEQEEKASTRSFLHTSIWV